MGLCWQQNVWVWLLAQFLCAVSSDKGLLNRAPLRGVPRQFPTAIDGFLEIRNLSPQHAVCHYCISRISALLSLGSSAYLLFLPAAAVLFMSSPQHGTLHAVAHTCWANYCHGCFARVEALEWNCGNWQWRWLQGEKIKKLALSKYWP